MNALPGLGHYRTAEVPARRFREAGDLTLDFTHQDGRIEDRWLALHPRDFAILWRLAERPGKAVCEAVLAADLSRVRFGCEAGDIAEHVASLTARLAGFGLGEIIAPHPEGGYVLATGAHPHRPLWTARRG